MKLISWNVNGIRAAVRKGLLEYLEGSNADVFCFQEIKAHPADLQHIEWPDGYQAWWNPARKKGYAGTALLCRVPPMDVRLGIGHEDYDAEGRVITAEFRDFYLVNVYVPNVQHGLLRMGFRQKWDDELHRYLKNLERGKPVALCGDLNVAHEPIDLARPKANVGNPGFTDEEREGFRTFLRSGLIDTFREFQKDGGHYTWWTYRAGARERNIGWRIDYFLVSPGLRPRLQRAWIEPEVMGSDHCPVGIELGAPKK